MKTHELTSRTVTRTPIADTRPALRLSVRDEPVTIATPAPAQQRERAFLIRILLHLVAERLRNIADLIEAIGVLIHGSDDTQDKDRIDLYG